LVRENFKVATFTTDVGGIDLAAATQLIDEACQEWGVKMVCFPEQFLNGIVDRSTTKQDLLRRAEPIPGPTSRALGEKAKQYGIYIVGGSIIELMEGDVLYDTCCFIGPDGEVVGKVSTCYGMLNTAIKYKAGAGFSLAPEEMGPKVFETPLGRVGIVIAEDRHKSKAKERIRSGKPDVIFVPASCSSRASGRTIMELYDFASSCLSYLVFANMNGVRRNVRDVGDMWYDGHSTIINPVGHPVAQTTVSTMRPMEVMAVAMIDLKLLDQIRKNVANRDEAIALPW